VSALHAVATLLVAILVYVIWKHEVPDWFTITIGILWA
jgi:hypothetical protein